MTPKNVDDIIFCVTCIVIVFITDYFICKMSKNDE